MLNNEFEILSHRFRLRKHQENQQSFRTMENFRKNTVFVF